MTVARPTAVRATITPSSSAKCAPQSSARGLNNGVSSPVTGSREAGALWAIAPLVTVALLAAERQVIPGSGAAVLLGDDMVYLVSQQRVLLGDQAVLAAVLGSGAHRPPQGRGNPR